MAPQKHFNHEIIQEFFKQKMSKQKYGTSKNCSLVFKQFKKISISTVFKSFRGHFNIAKSL